MKISIDKLIGLDVETSSGQQLGRVESLNLETDTQSVLEYIVKPSSLVKGLVKSQLIISRGQVVDITAKKITVDDNVVVNKNEAKKVKTKEKVVEGVTMKKI